MCYNSVTAMMQKSRPVHGAALARRESMCFVRLRIGAGAQGTATQMRESEL